MWANRGISDNDKKQRSDTMKEYIKDNPEYVKEISESVKKKWQEKSKWYEVTFPNGEKKQIKCLRGWCNENKLPYYKLYNTIRYNRMSNDGWLVEIIND